MLKKLTIALMAREMRNMERKLEKMPRNERGMLMGTPQQVEDFNRRYARLFMAYRSMGGSYTDGYMFKHPVDK